MKIFLWILSIFLIIAGIVVSYIFFKNLSVEYTYKGGGEILLDKTGQVGDFIGGLVGTIFSLAGFIILIITLSAQTLASYIEQFENKFFELIRLHRDNVSEIVIKRKSRNEEGELREFEFVSRQAFKIILNDFVTCRNELRQYFYKFSVDEIYEPDYLKEIIKILNVEKSHIRVKSVARINIAYCIIFYGVGTEGFQILEKVFQKKYKPEFYLPLLQYIQMKPILASKYWEKWQKFREIDKIVDRIEVLNQITQLRKNGSNDKKSNNTYYYDNNFIKFYGGHQHRLGHYYRHLFQTVKFVNSQNRLTEKQKYFYVKTLRAQLSTYEQALLFVNSLSILGMPWDFKPEFEESKFDFINQKRIRNNRLITKYNLIKNLPGENILGIDYLHYYPTVKYEIPREIPDTETE